MQDDELVGGGSIVSFSSPAVMRALLLALSIFVPTPPTCSDGTAWVDRMSDPPAVLQQAKCDGCEAVCDKVGTKSEGWYSSCDGSLIEWTMCGTREPVACTMDAKLCPDGVTYVGRDGSNNCEWQKCPGEGVPDTQCAPYVCADGTTVDRCTPEGTVINYFAEPCLTHGGEEGAPFKDVTSDHVNADAIFYVKQQSIVQGYEDGTYKPESTINRAEFVKILMGAFPSDGRMCKIAPFADVDQSAWYASFAHMARCQGIIDGYPDGSFRPENSINFAEAAKILANVIFGAGEMGFEVTHPEPWYAEAVFQLTSNRYVPVSIRTPDQLLTRGEMAEMIYRWKTDNFYKPSPTYEELLGGAGQSSSGTATDDSCTETYASTGVCPAATCIMDCADRDNPPKEGLGCPPGCFEKE